MGNINISIDQRRRTINLLRLLSVAVGAVLIALAVSRPGFAQAIDIDRVAAELEPEIHRTLIDGKIPSASIAIVSGDKIIWTGAYGYSNLWARTPATTSTVYLIGSTFKAMSTVALLQLMEEGKFKLDDRVNDYLTEFKIQNEDPKNPVTFRHLVTHTSGLPGGFGAYPVWGDTVPPSFNEYLSKSLVIGKPTGSVVIYSNPAYTLIGYLVQKFSGKPYKQYMQEKVFTPLEMTSTAFEPTPVMDERISMPYTVDEKTGSQVPAVRVKAAVWPAGIVYGTIGDQANWLIANLNGGAFKDKRILSEQTVEQIFTRQHDRFAGRIEGIWGNETAGFGLTWWVQVRDGERYFAHSGSLAGYTAFLLGNRDRKLGFAILTNGNRAHAHLFKLADRAMDLLKKHSVTQKTVVAGVSR